MPNLVAASSTKEQINCTHDMKIDVNDGTPVLEKCSSTECALMVNLLCSEGKPGKVHGSVLYLPFKRTVHVLVHYN